MPASCTIIDGILRIDFHGASTPQDFMMLADMVEKMEQQHAGPLPRIVDTTHVTTVGVGLGDMRELANRRRMQPPPYDARGAIVANTAVTRKLARAYQMLNDQPRIQLRVFETLDEALGWVRGDARAPARAAQRAK